MQILSEDQLIGHKLGKYRVERFVGQGRLNSVYLVRHQESQRVDAFTLYLIPEHFSAETRALFLNRFRKEAAAITTLEHPNILPVYEYGELSGYPYLITPYTMYGSLADIIKQQGRCEHTFVSTLLMQIIDGLEYAHQHGCVHGTLKPSNIVVRSDEALQVAGFGLMHMLQRTGVETSNQPYGHMLSIADTFLAAPEYMAPEFVLGKKVDARSDIYAVGCILFELLSGRPPFSGSDPLLVAQQHAQLDAPLLRTLVPSIPVALSSVVKQSLERDPARRFQNIRELGDAFIQVSQGASTQSVPVVSAQLPTTDAFPLNKLADKQEISRKNFNTGRWQLMPPIVTEHLPSVKPPQASSSRQKDATKTARIVPVPPTLLPPVPASLSVPAQPKIPTTPQAQPPMQSQPQAPDQISGKVQEQEIQNSVKAWWSLDDNPLQPKPAPPAEAASRGLAQPGGNAATANEARAAKANDVLGQAAPDLDWMEEPPSRLRQTPMAASMGRKRSDNLRLDSKIKRRNMVALLAAGGVVAAGAALAINLGHLGGIGAQQASTQTNTQAGTQTTNQQTGAQMKNQTKTQAKSGHTGTVVGKQTQAANTAVSFTNPANNTAGLLVHLPQGNFVAYERACTHVGVLVNYDPATQMFVCPAHGAIFDPANGGAVVQGPAQLPLPKINVQVNGDGTITTV